MKTPKRKKITRWKGWAIATQGGELRYVTGDRKYKPVLPMVKGDLKRIRVVITESRS